MRLTINEGSAYNLDNAESRRKEVADRFGKSFTPDDHILICKDGKKLNIQVGKKYKCTACNGQRVEIVSIDELFPEDDGDSALITAYYRGKMIAIGSTQLYEHSSMVNKSRTVMSESEKYSDGNVNFSVPYDTTNLDEWDREQFDSLIDWCNDYLSEYGLDAYVTTTRHYQNELSVFYDIEDLETTTHTDVMNAINSAIEDFCDDFYIEALSYKKPVVEKISDNDYSESKKGIAYKVFRVKGGKLYPPMVANPGGEDTPVGVWLDAEEGEFAGLSKTGRKQVKSTGSGNLAYRPGWHLGDVPRAKQFDRSFSWQTVDDVDDSEITKTVNTMKSFISGCAKASNIGKIYYVKETDECYEIVNNNAPYFPYDFIWAECEYVMDINYQSEADEQGYMRTKPDGSTYRSDKYQHSLAGLPKLPKGGYYKYRTNPNPDTVPWVITGAIKVTKLLDDYDVQKILGSNAPERQGGDKTLAELGLKQI